MTQELSAISHIQTVASSRWGELWCKPFGFRREIQAKSLKYLSHYSGHEH